MTISSYTWSCLHKKSILGINFGQSYASIAVIDKEGHPTCIANEEGERQIACAISYAGEQVYIGNGAKPHLVKNGKNTIMGFRNLLGHSYDEVDHTAILTAPLISTSTTPAYTVDVLIPPPAKGNKSGATSGAATPAAEPVASQKTLSVPEVTTLFLSTLFTSATDFLGTKPTAAVISAPSWFTAEQKDALRKAAKAAGINVLQVLDEAAAVLVGYRTGLSEERKERGLLVVVLDMGETSLNVTVAQVSEGEYTVLAKGQDDKVGGREFDNLLLKHFAKEFTKKTKIALDLPCGESAPDADKRAEAKLRLAVEHTKRSLSASSGAATCAVESLKDGYDISSSINRLRFDGLAAPVYRKISAVVSNIVKEADLDLAQIDEVLLAGASTLFPGLQSNLSYSFPATTPVTATIDPAEVIAVGCALEALHLSTLSDGLKIEDVLATAAEGKVDTTSAPIGIVLPGQEANTLAAVVVESGAPLPVRRRVAIPAPAGKVALELWEGKHEVNVDLIQPPPREKDEDDEDDEDDEEDEPEEVKTAITVKTKALGAVEVELKKENNLVLEVIVQRGGGLEVRAWEEGREEEADKFEA
ncbi:hsp71-like protein [Cryptococcus wingfieldii CBS 7118]|uniref:Hsp71-like protein n=1 Tax=Cryptococcus wingfieldii CBS 7118 TaxID=1295528 RepID=A0A1E3J6N1_9TREE|nr:hsp71-like protein [Cryptococcus wingfieldii CBS 7118]ODN96502.1 hsp71-like protein [Cryptococcus wingfieldii CBS 7118]